MGKEAQWIQSQEYFIKRPISNEHIIIFLKYFRVNHYDVPYITTYLQDEYPLDITSSDVWKIDEFDQKYQHIHLRKQNIMNYLQQIQQKLEKNNITNDNEEIIQINNENMRWLKLIKEAKTFLYDAQNHEELE